MTNLSVFETSIEQEPRSTEPSNLRELLNQWLELEDFEKIGVLFSIWSGEHQGQILRQILTPKKTESTSVWPEEYKFSEQVSNSCLEFADCHGLNDFLEQCFRAVRKLFSNIKALSADLDQFRDEETEDIGHIVIRLKVASNKKTALREYDMWADWTVQHLTPEECTRFTLTISRV